jgi:hypothetical protein
MDWTVNHRMRMVSGQTDLAEMWRLTERRDSVPEMQVLVDQKDWMGEHDLALALTSFLVRTVKHFRKGFVVLLAKEHQKG